MPEHGPPLRDNARAGLHWLTQGLADVPDNAGWLSAGERALLDSMRFAKRRADWRLGRWTAKRAVCFYLRLRYNLPELASLEIRAALDGAPEVFLNAEPAPVSLSISHSHGMSLCAVASSGVALGCDLELVMTRADNFVRDYFADEEISLLARTSDEERPLFNTLIWSAKESALKALRQGLRRDTRSAVVSIDPAKRESGWSPLAVRCIETSRIFHGWWRISSDFIQTLVADTLPTRPVGLGDHSSLVSRAND